MGTLFGLVYGMVSSGGRAATGANVLVINADGETISSGETGRTDATGVFRIPYIEPGTHTLRVIHAGDTLDVAGVRIDRGASGLNIEL